MRLFVTLHAATVPHAVYCLCACWTKLQIMPGSSMFQAFRTFLDFPCTIQCIGNFETSWAHLLSLYVQARTVAKRKTLWGRVKSGSQGVLPKERQRQLAGVIKERPWLAPASVMAAVIFICALVWIFTVYGI